MGLIKREYTHNETIISAENMNAIQEAIIDLEDGLFSVDNYKSGEVIAITDAAQRGLRSLNIFGKTTQDGTPTPDIPVDLVSVGDDGYVDIGIYGKNLLQVNKNAVGESYTHGGITFYRNADNSITMNGTATENAFYSLDYLGGETKYPVNTDLIASIGGLVSGVAMHCGYFDKNNAIIDSVVILRGNTLSALYQLPEDAALGRTYISVVSGTKLSNVVIYPMIRLASATDPTYEAYKVSAVASVATPGGMPGIPVATGGNYTDASGQQWICDEIDFVRGVYIKRLDKIVYDGSSDEYWSKYGTDDNISFYVWPNKAAIGMNLSLCDRFKYVSTSWGSQYATTYGIYSDHSSVIGKYFRAPNENITTLEQWNAWLAENPTTLIYVMANPVESPLSAEQIAAFKVLRTNRGYTTVFNDSRAGMELEYVMDAKNYFDNLVIGGTIIPAIVE